MLAERAGQGEVGGSEGGTGGGRRLCASRGWDRGRWEALC